MLTKSVIIDEQKADNLTQTKMEQEEPTNSVLLHTMVLNMNKE